MAKGSGAPRSSCGSPARRGTGGRAWFDLLAGSLGASHGLSAWYRLAAARGIGVGAGVTELRVGTGQVESSCGQLATIAL